MKPSTASTGTGMSTTWLNVDHRNNIQVAMTDGEVSTIGSLVCGAGGRNGLAAMVCSLST